MCTRIVVTKNMINFQSNLQCWKLLKRRRRDTCFLVPQTHLKNPDDRWPIWESKNYPKISLRHYFSVISYYWKFSIVVETLLLICLRFFFQCSSLKVFHYILLDYGRGFLILQGIAPKFSSESFLRVYFSINQARWRMSPPILVGDFSPRFFFGGFLSFIMVYISPSIVILYR